MKTKAKTGVFLRNYTDLLIYHRENRPSDWLSIYKRRQKYIVLGALLTSVRPAGCFVCRNIFKIYLPRYILKILILSDFCECCGCMGEIFPRIYVFFVGKDAHVEFPSGHRYIEKIKRNLAIIKSSKRRVENRIVSNRCRSAEKLKTESWKLKGMGCRGDRATAQPKRMATVGKLFNDDGYINSPLGISEQIAWDLVVIFTN